MSAYDLNKINIRENAWKESKSKCKRMGNNKRGICAHMYQQQQQ